MQVCPEGRQRTAMTLSVSAPVVLLTILVVFPKTDSFQILPKSRWPLQGRHQPIIKQVRSPVQGITKPKNGSGRCNVSRTFPCACYPSTHSLRGPAIDCSRRNLSFIPSGIPTDAFAVNISHNNLKNLSSGIFHGLSRLEQLDLSNNNIDYFGTGIFLGLNHLRTLLVNNNPFILSTSFADDVFAPLTNLTYLNLKPTRVPYDLQEQYPDVALAHLPSLETLLIKGLPSTSFGAGVQNLTSLKTLDFSGSPDFTSLSKQTFAHFINIHIKTLNLSWCDLQWIDRETFFDLKFIDTIDYSYNQNLKLTGVGNSTFGLQNSTIRRLILQLVYPQSSITILTHEDLQYLRHTNLEEFRASNNSIGGVGEGAIDDMPLSLKVLDISWNNIQIYRNQLFQALRLGNLEIFDVSYQEVYQFQNPSSVLKQEGLDNITRSEAGSDVWHHWKSDDISKLEYFAVSLPPKLWLIECSHTYKLRFTVPYFKVVNSSVKVAKFANNLLSRWEGPVLGLETVHYLDLSGNNCDFVSPYFFGYMTGLKTLLIGNNHLGQELDDLTFHNLSSLRHLGMESNRLEDVGPNLFSSLSNLTSLNISGNYLSDWNANISGLRHLEVLDLSNNKLTSLPQRLLDDLDSIRESKPVQIDIHRNQFKCTCATKYFVNWFTETKVQFKNLESTFCTLANGTRVSLTQNEAVWKYLHSSCRSYAVLIGVLSGCLAIVLVIVSGAVIHRYRWKLRYLYYMAANRRERTGYQRLDSAEDKPFGFDAFISYEDSDRPFITEHIIPRLEGEARLKLCIDKRDFIPGLYVTDNIMNAIQNSRKTVVLLSRQFLKSKWCMYELNMARMEGIYNDRPLLVVVLLEEVPTAILAAEVLEVIHDQTYIERTENEYGQALFWQRLIGALKSDI